MINTDMLPYKIPRTVKKTDGYGQTITYEDWVNPAGVVMMAVYATDYDTQRTGAWEGAAFVGLTQDITYGPYEDGVTGDIIMGTLKPDDILQGETPLNLGGQDKFQVISISRRGRYFQVFMQETYK
jgi:hypothetical protein